MDITGRELVQEPDKYIKSNFLISSKYKSSLFENKLMALSLYHIDEAQFDTSGALVQELSAAEIRRRLNIKGNGMYGQLERAARNMTGQTVGMTNPEERCFDYIAVIIRSTYKNGKLTIKFNQDIAQYISNIKNNYTQLPLDVMLSFKSNNSFRLYEVLRSKVYYKKGDIAQEGDVFRISFSLAELKLTMGIVNANLEGVKNVLNGSQIPDYEKAVAKSPEKLFEDWRNFKTQVLEVAIEEINEKSDINVAYDVTRSGQGGKIKEVVFYVQFKEDKSINIVEGVSDEQKEQIIDAVIDLIEEKVKIKDVKRLCEIAEYDLDKIKKAYKILKESRAPVNSIIGFMISAIKNDYSEPIGIASKGTKNKFNNFEQRNNDYEQIEMMLLSAPPFAEKR